jgi:DNA polymerase V
MFALMDCNNFFVSCERLFRPDLRTRPVAVLSSNDGCIVARSEEVKALGVPMGVPYFQVKDILTKADAVLFSSNFTLYRDISSRVMRVLEDEVGLCDVYSIDEAFFELPQNITKAEVALLRENIIKKVGIPVSIGVAKTKTLAKFAAKLAKKEGGVAILDSARISKDVLKAPCEAVWGLGRQTAKKLHGLGVYTVGEYLALPRPQLRTQCGVVGERIAFELSGTAVFGLGERSDDVQQSIMSTRSFEKTTTQKEHIESALAYHIEEVAKKLREKNLCAQSLSIMVLPSRHGDYFLRSGRAQCEFSSPTAQTSTLLKDALRMLEFVWEEGVPYKKAGVVVGGLVPKTNTSASLFEQVTDVASGTLDSVLDALNDRFGHSTIHSGLVYKGAARGSAKLRSKEYTTSWEDIPNVRA